MKTYFGFLILFALCLGQISFTQLAKDYQQTIDQMAINEMGSTILQEIQMKMRSEDSLYNQLSIKLVGDRQLATIVTLMNTMEKDLVQEEQEDAEKLQANTEQFEQQKSEVKDSIAQAQYSSSNLGDKVAQLQEANGKQSIRKEEKTYLLSEYTKLLEQLNTIRDEESQRYSSNRDEILNTVDIVKRARYLISQLIPKPYKPTVLTQQALNPEDNQYSSFDDAIKQFESFKREITDQLGEQNNAYFNLISSFTQLHTSAPVKKDDVDAMVQILSRLYEDLMDTNTNLYKAEQDRQANYDSLVEKCSGDIQFWETQVADIDKDIEDTKQKINDYNTRKGEDLQKLEHLQKQQDDIQTLIEDEKVNFNQRKKDRDQYLYFIRKIKSILSDDFEGATKYILNKKFEN